MASYEVAFAHRPSYEELLMQYDDDPLGYVAQALTAIRAIPSSSGLVPIAEFASDMGNVPLMVSCFPGMNSVEKWRLFGYDSQQGASTIPIELLESMGEKLGQLELDGRFTDRPTIACIYAAQLGLIPPTEGNVLQAHLGKLEGCIGDAGRIDRLSVVQTLCLAGLLDDAKRFSVHLHEDDMPTYLALAKLQQSRIRAKHVPICKIEAEFVALRQLDPTTYVEQRRAAIRQDRYIYWRPADIKALLQANEILEARRIYEQLVQNSHVSNFERARMALWMTRAEVTSNSYDAVEAMSHMAGCREFVTGAEKPDDIPEMRAAAEPEIARRIMKTGQLLLRMPFSSTRVALQLELNDIQQALLPDNTNVRDFCRQIAAHSWHVAVATLTDAHAQKLADHSQVIRELQIDYRESNLEIALRCTPKGRTIEPRPRLNWLDIIY